MTFRMFAAAAAMAGGLLAGPAAASIPPPAWTPPSWTGPAKVCAEAFALELQAGETARQGYPSVGVIRYTLETAKGAVEIAELWEAGPPQTAPEAEDRDGGVLRPLADAGDAFAGYLFTPEDPNGLPVSVVFHPGAWKGVDLDGVLGRIDFGGVSRKGCTEPAR